MNVRARWAAKGFCLSTLVAGVVLGCGGGTEVVNNGDGGSDGRMGHDGSNPPDVSHGHDSAPDHAADHATKDVSPPPGDGGHLTAAGKVDLLFDIDNSASMGDKQAYLEKAVPDLVGRLVNPNCVQSDGTVSGPSTTGSCSAYPGSTIEFPPVHDMHIGIISSSLGTRGVTGAGAVCSPGQMTNPFLDGKPAIPSHTDDRGELLNRTSSDSETEGTSADEGGQNFLDWFPSVPANAGKTATGGVPQALSPVATVLTSNATLETDFQALITGVHFYGCGIESQLESWYRFLVQPDPYDSIKIGSSGLATWSGVDAVIIKQRHDFLRPDSVVAIIDLTDENDSEIDVRSFGGQGYKFMDDSTFQPPRGTSECAATPTSAKCTSCAYGTAATKADPSCKTNGGVYSAITDWGFYINVRHVHMQQKYGIVPQFPLQRYVLGLTSPRVPDRSHEYPAGATSYQGGTVTDSMGTVMDPFDLNCTNPLFAATLPDGSDVSQGALCNVAGAGGPRAPGLVFYAHIGGVPHQLLQTTPGDGVCPSATAPADCPQKETLTASDWKAILGANPDTWDYTGIDPHMVESYAPRPSVPALTTGPNPTGGGADMINGGDWVTDTASPQHGLPVDREFACIFPLATPRDCSNGADFVAQEACDCSVPGLPPSAVPSVCGLKDPTKKYASGTNDYTTQYYAKAYPTIRELELAELLGTQGVVSSLCPIHVTDNSTNNDPLFGYRPAVSALVTRMKGAIGP